MKTKEFLVTFKNKETLSVFDEFYIEANNLNEAIKIADVLTHEYDDINYSEISATIEPA